MIIPANTLDRVWIKCMSNIPPGYFMVVDTPGQVPYRPGGTPHHGNYSMTGDNCQVGISKEITSTMFINFLIEGSKMAYLWGTIKK